MKTTYTLLLLLFCTVISNAQKITVFNSSNSNLPNYDAYDASNLLVDTKGDVWMCIRGYGIYEYDGHEFSHIDTLDKYASPRFADKEGNVWFENGSTIIKFDGKNWVKYTKEQTGIENRIFTMAEAPSGKLYIGTSDGLYTFDGSHWEQLNLPNSDMYIYEIRGIEFGAAGEIFAGSSQGLLIFNGKEWKILNEHNSKIPSRLILNLKHSPTGDLYICYTGGFCFVSNNNWINYDKNNLQLLNQQLWNIAFTDNTVWIGTGNGVLKIKDNKWNIIKLTKSDPEIISGLAAYNNILWVSTPNGLIKYEE